MCRKSLSPGDRKVWQQAIALLMGLKVRNGIGEKDLAGAVETALHHSAGGGSGECEGCGLKRPNFGLPAEGKVRWCDGCAKAHAGAEEVKKKKCEDCQLKCYAFGMPAEGKRRWCAGCAKAHAGAVDVANKKCEGCGLKQPTFVLPSDVKKKRWCRGCAPKAAHASLRRTQAGGSLEKEPQATDPP